MTRRRVVLAALVVAVGTVFLGQGSGILGGSSAMVDDTRWAWFGGAMVVAGLVLGALALFRDRNRFS